MAGRFDEEGVDALTRLIRQQIEQADIDAGLKSLFLYIIANSAGFLEFASAYLQQKATGTVNPSALLAGFLKSKGKSLADFGVSVMDSEMVSDAWAIVSLILDVKDSLKYSSDGLIGIALTARRGPVTHCY